MVQTGVRITPPPLSKTLVVFFKVVEEVNDSGASELSILDQTSQR